ncbi:hypothetical protein Tco_0672196, partial [Tanacetum coccineum]
GNEVKVSKRCLVKFNWKKYNDEVWCDVVLMDACHMLLGSKEFMAEIPKTVDVFALVEMESNQMNLPYHNRIELPDEYNVSGTFNVADVSMYVTDEESIKLEVTENVQQDSRMNLLIAGEYDGI